MKEGVISWGSCNVRFKVIEEIINNYIQNIFNGKQFRNEIDPELGKFDVILRKIPIELIQNQYISQDKQKEINDKIKNQVNNAVIIFNKKREQLPLFEKFISKKEELYNKIADEKIKELMSKFYYMEDAIPFKTDNFYALINPV